MAKSKRREPKAVEAWATVDAFGDIVMAFPKPYTRNELLGNGWPSWRVIRVRISPLREKKKARRKK